MPNNCDFRCFAAKFGDFFKLFLAKCSQNIEIAELCKGTTEHNGTYSDPTQLHWKSEKWKSENGNQKKGDQIS